MPATVTLRKLVSVVCSHTPNILYNGLPSTAIPPLGGIVSLGSLLYAGVTRFVLPTRISEIRRESLDIPID